MTNFLILRKEKPADAKE